MVLEGAEGALRSWLPYRQRGKFPKNTVPVETDRLSSLSPLYLIQLFPFALYRILGSEQSLVDGVAVAAYTKIKRLVQFEGLAALTNSVNNAANNMLR